MIEFPTDRYGTEYHKNQVRSEVLALRDQVGYVLTAEYLVELAGELMTTINERFHKACPKCGHEQEN